MKQRILLTGGGTGIGRALAIELSKRGHLVLTCGRRRNLVVELKASHPAVHVTVADITKHEDRLRLLDEANGLFKGFDVLINNAGVQEQQVYGRGTLDQTRLQAEISANLIAPMLLTDLAIPYLKSGNAPAILNLVSLLAIIPKPSAPGYCASKAGLLAFTRSLRMQLSDTPIRVVEVFPPLVDTPMTVGRGPSKMSAEICAAKLADGLEARKTVIAIGESIKLLPLARWWPWLAQRALSKMILPTSVKTVPTSI